MNKVLILSVLLILFHGIEAQQLIINEVSQGTGSSEYVELVVIGTPTCVTPVPSLDLRKVIIDDNNGYFAPGSGTGIAGGAVRFANIPFWQSIPQGTYIVIYNDASPNTSLPPDDNTMADGNCRLVIPANSMLLEKTTVSPTTTNQAYPPDANWTLGGSWSPLAMSNSDDSFQVPNIPSTGVPFHSVSWGNNSTNAIVYFAGSAAGKVFSFTNTTSNNWNLVANWTSADVATGQTPGMANNAANDAWIGSMNPLCSVNPGMMVSPTISNETCANACDGSISTNVTNGLAPYTYSWSNGATTSSLVNVCPGSYTVTVTGANGCSVIETFTISAGTQGSNAAITAAGPFTNQDAAQQIQALNGGGVWSSTCGACLSPNGMFNPQVAGIGTWPVCYVVGSGNCADTQCISIIVTNGCTPQTTTESLTICPGDSAYINGSWESAPGQYSAAFQDVNLCDSTHIANLSFFTALSFNENITLCEFDSVLVFNQWIFTAQTLTQVEQTTNGCDYVHTVNVQLEECVIEPSVIYIPNVFTPNGDLVNDTFEIIIQNGKVERGWIFNRWGNVICTFSPTQLKWDGKDEHSGLPVLDGVYTYILYFNPGDTVKELYQGFVTVLK
ncbi:MAG: gliding motility-associated C-terminal domain-containing protein [Crocinitomicaceae bacterium]|nr:gliding motility-associated C-terminal domain-containing protein [Crocinitomicaceae bacterium]MBP6032588.1 gliding motility-associated C-terminal domain-containing protein [Crocinitomicaceae bacterium]